MNNKIKHLEMIEAVIQRMANNSFQLKGWSVTIVSVIGGLSATGSDKRFFLLSFIPLVVFWFLDSFYLQLERKYRNLYEKVRREGEDQIDFSMNVSNVNLSQEQAKKICFFSCIFSRTEAGLYIPIIIAVGAMAIILKVW